MTAVDVTFKYGVFPTENEIRALDGAREVYGIRRITFDEKNCSVQIEYDASRMTADTVAGLLRRSGLDVRERIAGA